LRRSAVHDPAPPYPEKFSGDGLEVDLARQQVTVDGREVHLAPTEFQLLTELIRQPNQILAPEFLLIQVWGPKYKDQTRLLWQALHRLRQKIEADPQHPRYIRTRQGVGYIFTVPDPP
jgi:DNA-binding response OmpR family regulator